MRIKKEWHFLCAATITIPIAVYWVVICMPSRNTHMHKRTPYESENYYYCVLCTLFLCTYFSIYRVSWDIEDKSGRCSRLYSISLLCSFIRSFVRCFSFFLTPLHTYNIHLYNFGFATAIRALAPVRYICTNCTIYVIRLYVVFYVYKFMWKFLFLFLLYSTTRCIHSRCPRAQK